MTTQAWSSLINGQTVAFDPNQDLLDFGIINANDIGIAALSASSTQFNAGGKSVTFNGFGVDQIVTRELFSAAFENLRTSGFSRLLVGDNLLAAGDAAANTLTGGGFADQLIGLGGSDTLYGSYGSDILDGGAGDDVLDGGAGFSTDIDTVTYATATSGVSVSLAVSTPQNTVGAGTDTLSNFENLTGSAFDDNLVGSSGNNVITGGAGNDTLDGGAGNDTASYSMAASAVTVSLAGGSATGGDGLDTLSNFETLVGSAFADSLTGSGAANRLDGQAGHDTLIGGLGDDTLVGGLGNDSLSGGDGNDQLSSGVGNDALDGGDGSDTADFSSIGTGVTINLQGGTASGQGWSGTVMNVENLIGTASDDTLSGSAGDNNLFGDNGNDILSGLAGNDTLNGGGSTDTADYSAASAAVSVSLAIGGAQATGGAGSDTLISIERLLGSNFADTLTGSSANDILDGGAGNDVIDGGFGSDVVSYTSAAGGIAASLSIAGPQNTVAAGFDTLSHIENLEGSGFDDVLTGDANANELSAYLGNDTVIGLAGNDTLRGWGGNDSLDGGSGDDILYGGVGDDQLSGGDGIDLVSYALAENGVTVNLGVSTTQNTGSEGFDTLLDIEKIIGSSYDDTLLGGAGSEFLDGGAGSGHDSLEGAGGNDTLLGGLSPDTLKGGLGNDSLSGGGVDFYWTGSQYQVLWGTDGDRMEGGAGDDIYVVTTSRTGVNSTQQYMSTGSSRSLSTINSPYAPDQVIELSNEGTDTVQSYVSYVLPEHVEALELIGIFSINGTGNDLNNVLKGNSETNNISGLGGNDIIEGGGGNDTVLGGDGNDVLDGGSGADSLTGGDGNDYYFVDNAGDLVVESNASVIGGNDVIYHSLAAYTLSANVESGRILATGAASLTGNDLANLLFAGLGDNVLNGGAGSDTVTWQYGVSGGAGVSASLAGGVATGSGNDTLLGIENLTGSANADSLSGDGNANTLSGGAGNDTLFGVDGVDVLDGGSGADSLEGGDGNDYYFVDNAGDQVIESNAAVAGGNDVVYSTLAAYTLSTNVESGRIVTSGVASLTGNGLANVLYTGTGNGTLSGAAGNDSLYGGNGVDVLDGGSGADALSGGDGNDYYFVDNAGDLVVESNAAVAGGNDVIYSALAAYTLGANVEIGRIVTGGAASLSGNSLANLLLAGPGNSTLGGGAGNDTLSGGGGSDVLDGGSGADLMSGGDGNDYYFVDNTGDQVVERNAVASGNDVVYHSLAACTLSANVEIGRILATGAANLSGNELANLLFAGLGDNVLDGGAGADMVSWQYGVSGGVGVSASLASGTATGSGNDTLLGIEHLTGSANADSLSGDGNANALNGGSGNDTLAGGLGNDWLGGGGGADVFRFDTLPDGVSNRDTISDFSVVDDSIELENAVFTSLLTGPLATSAFRAAAGATSAADADDTLIYDSTTGALYYDAAGNTGPGPVQIALLGAGLALSSVDFLVT